MGIASSAYPENELAKEYLGVFKPWERLPVIIPSSCMG
jgi:hypothetical protein